eukprot:gene61923-biopygen33279
MHRWKPVLTHADRTKKFIWTAAAESGFLDLQDAIRKCAKLYFLVDDEDAPIVLRADASNYGYGAYLCQLLGSGVSKQENDATVENANKRAQEFLQTTLADTGVVVTT